MPVISKELHFELPFGSKSNLGRRDATVIARPPHDHITDITPHVLMLPTAIKGCKFGIVSLPSQDNDRLQNTDGKIIIIPPLQQGEELSYTIFFLLTLMKRGKLAWPVKHPTKSINFMFFSSSNFFPGRWEVSLLPPDLHSGSRLNIPIEIREENVSFQVDEPALGSNLLISWS